MEKIIKKGDRFLDPKNSKIEIVDCIDVYENVTLVFTESKKYFEINNVIPIVSNYVTEQYLIDKLFGCTLDDRKNRVEAWVHSIVNKYKNKIST